MKKEITLESIYELLSGFIVKQEAFNVRIENKIDQFQEEEKANHNLSHRMIMQSFEAISDIRSELDETNSKPWLKK